MKLSRGASGRMDARKTATVAFVACLLLPCIVLSIIKYSNIDTFSVWNLQLSIRSSVQLARIQGDEADGTDSLQPGIRVLSVALKEDWVIKNQSSPPPLDTSPETRENKTVLGLEVESITHFEEKQRENMSHAGIRVLPIALKEEEWVKNQSSLPAFDTSTETRENNTVLGIEVESIAHFEEKHWENKSHAGNENINPPIYAKEMRRDEQSNTTTKGANVMNTSSHFEGNNSNSSSHFQENPRGSNSKTVDTHAKRTQLLHVRKEDQELENKLWCDFTQDRSDTCFMHGNVRVLGPSSSLILHSPSPSNDASSPNTTWKIRPYPRKWETNVMQNINEVTLRFLTKGEEISPCSVSHKVPAIVFSTGGFLGNFFHDFTDVLIPLFISSRQYHGEVQFLITNFNSQWINKYRTILKQLSKYEIINMEQDGRVHCFPQAQVGLMSHKVLGIEPSKCPNGYSMSDFRDMLRTSFSLKRKSIVVGSKRPRLLILQRRGSRSLMNKREVVGLGRSLGFKVVVAGPEEARNLSRFARVVNSCDAMIGVHGAGLANMLFLPAGAPMIQIVPWGGLTWACRHDFGEPALDMGVKYLEYEIKEEESSLIQQYPRDHPVFTDPLSIQRQGWNVLWSVFLQKQSVKLDVRRFKPTLLQALQSLQ